MPNSKKVDIDHLIQEAFIQKTEEEMKAALPPEEAWERLQRERRKKQKQHRPRRFIGRAAIGLVAAVLLLLLVKPTTNGIATYQFTDLFHNIQGSVTQLLGKIGGDGTEMPEGDPRKSQEFEEGAYTVIEGSESKSELMSLEEARTVVTFPLGVPSELPEEFSLKQVTVVRKVGEQSNEAILNYVGDGRGFLLTEIAVDNQFGFSEVMDSDDAAVTDFEMKGQKASLIEYKNGTRKLVWVTQGRFFSLEGQLTKEEIISIAKSI